MAKFLARHLKIPLFLENFMENPYLECFYGDMKKWSFHSQLFFLKENFKSHLKIQELGASCIQDRTIFEDSEIFAANLFERGLMDRRDFETYRDLYQTMLRTLNYPDLIIYLHAPIEVLLERISSRNRDFEKTMSQSYLSDLNQFYKKWIERIQEKTQILKIDSSKFNIYDDEKQCETILEMVREQLIL